MSLELLLSAHARLHVHWFVTQAALTVQPASRQLADIELLITHLEVAGSKGTAAGPPSNAPIFVEFQTVHLLIVLLSK